MGNCKDCRFWDSDQRCQKADWSVGDYTAPEDVLVAEVSVLDDSGLFVDIRTGPEFGCVLFHERKHNGNATPK